MSNQKQLRISEIKENEFIIEERFYDNWFPLNEAGVVANGTEQKVYASIEAAEVSAKNFLIYPRVVKEVKPDEGNVSGTNDSYDNLDDPI